MQNLSEMEKIFVLVWFKKVISCLYSSLKCIEVTMEKSIIAVRCDLKIL